MCNTHSKHENRNKMQKNINAINIVCLDEVMTSKIKFIFMFFLSRLKCLLQCDEIRVFDVIELNFQPKFGYKIHFDFTSLFIFQGYYYSFIALMKL